MIKFLDNQEIIEEISKGFGDGDLTLICACTKCEAHFELNKESVAMAMATKTSFIEYLRWIQSSNCTGCNGKKNENI